MNTPSTRKLGTWLPLGLAVAVVAIAAATSRMWWPAVQGLVTSTIARSRPAPADGHDHAAEEEGHDHGEHEHAHDDGSALEVSAAARANLGLTDEFVKPIALRPYFRTITVPAQVIDRPGRTHLLVSAPLTGVVTHVHAVQGETVTPGSPLFHIRLTHEELVTLQTEFVQTVGELEVENQEIARLEGIIETGAVAAKTLLDRKYARDRLVALLGAQRGALHLHGLSEEQVNKIAAEKQLVRDSQIVAPAPDSHDADDDIQLLTPGTAAPVVPRQEGVLLTIESLSVTKGQAVAGGDALASLADYSWLYIEGHAFEHDAAALSRAVERDWTATAIFENQPAVEGLKLAYIDSAVQQDSRTLSFYVGLPNKVLRDATNADGQRFVSWQYRPGQRLQLQVPVEEWPNEIVLPVDAVAREGAESYVFQENGSHFDRVAVHVKHRDQFHVVIANDGTLFPGDVVAWRSAHQMLIALKNKSGGGVDPHAGHNH